MTIDIGKKVKNAKKKSAPVGILVGINGETAEVMYRGIYTRKDSTESLPLSDLVQVCSEKIYSDFSSYACDRPVKEGNLCGIHAGALKRREARLQKDKEALDAAKKYLAETRQLEAALNTQIDSRGLRIGAPSLKVLRAREGTVSIRLDELLTLIRNT